MKNEKLILVNKSDLSMRDFLDLITSVVPTCYIYNDLPIFRRYDDKGKLNDYKIIMYKNKISNKLILYKL